MCNWGRVAKKRKQQVRAADGDLSRSDEIGIRSDRMRRAFGGESRREVVRRAEAAHLSAAIQREPNVLQIRAEPCRAKAAKAKGESRAETSEVQSREVRTENI